MVLKKEMEGVMLNFKEKRNKSLFFKAALIAASVLTVLGFCPTDSSAQAVDSHAQEITLGEQVSTDLKGMSASKWYKITLDDSYMVELYGSSSTTMHGPSINVYDENGTDMFYLSFMVEPSGVKKANLKKGTYYLKANLAGGADVADPINIKFHLETTNFNIKKPSVKTAEGGKVVVSWKNLSSVNGYEVQISTSKDFSKNLKKYNVTGAGKKTKTLTLPKKMRGKKIYVRVRPYITDSGVKAFADYSGITSKKSKK